MKALVTGGTGFIGSHLVESLLRRGDHVRCLLRRTSDPTWLKGLPVETIYGDCSDKNSLKEAVRGVDLIFHLAGITKAVKEESFSEVNAFGTDNLIHTCLEHNPRLKKFIYLSSQAAAGPSRNGCRKKESDPCDPVSPYGRSKRMGEELALDHAHELPLLILRPSAVYGPRDRDIFAFFKFLSKRIKPCFGGHDQRISLCYVQDIVDAILLSADSKESKGEIFFLTDGHDYPMEEIGDVFEEAMELKAYRIRVPKWMIFRIAAFSEYVSRFSGRPSLISKGKAEEMVQRDWVCDITKALTVLGFQPKVTLPQGARLTVDWYRKQHWL